MNPLYEAALQLQKFFQSRGWKFCIIGGLAVGRWGQPRTTKDVDVNLFAGLGNEEGYVDEILANFSGRRSDARDAGLRNRVINVVALNGVPIDIGLAALMFEERMLERAKPIRYAKGVSLVTATADDLVIMKAFAHRPRDWSDIEGIIARQQNTLDWDYIVTGLREVCELAETPEIVDELLLCKQRIERE